MYPAFVNCTTIDWFSEWPQDALLEVADKYLENMEFANEEEVQYQFKTAINKIKWFFFGTAERAQSQEAEGNKVFLLYRLSLICEGFIEIAEYQFRNIDVTFAWLTFNVDEP